MLWFAWGLVGGPPPLHNAGFAVLGPVARGQSKKGVPSAVGFPHCAGFGEGLSLSPKPYPHKCAEAGARTRDLPVTDGRLYRCTRPALLSVHFFYAIVIYFSLSSCHVILASLQTYSLCLVLSASYKINHHGDFVNDLHLTVLLCWHFFLALH